MNCRYCSGTKQVLLLNKYVDCLDCHEEPVMESSSMARRHFESLSCFTNVAQIRHQFCVKTQDAAWFYEAIDLRNEFSGEWSDDTIGLIFKDRSRLLYVPHEVPKMRWRVNDNVDDDSIHSEIIRPGTQVFKSVARHEWSKIKDMDWKMACSALPSDCELNSYFKDIRRGWEFKDGSRLWTILYDHQWYIADTKNQDYGELLS